MRANQGCCRCDPVCPFDFRSRVFKRSRAHFFGLVGVRLFAPQASNSEHHSAAEHDLIITSGLSIWDRSCPVPDGSLACRCCTHLPALLLVQAITTVIILV